MWRRLLSSSHLKTLTLATASSAAAAAPCRSVPGAVRLADRVPISASASLFFRSFSTESDNTTLTKKVEDVMPIATGHEREELEAELKGIDLYEIDHPIGPFGTKEAPAIVKSYYDRRVVGCPGGEGEDEHDVVWFWLKKGEPHECPVCSQYFELEVVGPGGSPDGHEDDDDHHH